MKAIMKLGFVKAVKESPDEFWAHKLMENSITDDESVMDSPYDLILLDSINGTRTSDSEDYYIFRNNMDMDSFMSRSQIDRIKIWVRVEAGIY
jgi:hypothetical protein